MGIYTENQNFGAGAHDEVDVNLEELQEAFLYDEFGSAPDVEKKAMLEEGVLLEAKGKISRKTIVRLNKNDDLTRRTTMAALQLSKDANDNLWKALVANRIKERKLLAAIKKKWGPKAGIVAKKAQKDYISGTNRSKMLSAKDLNNRD